MDRPSVREALRRPGVLAAVAVLVVILVSGYAFAFWLGTEAARHEARPLPTTHSTRPTPEPTSAVPSLPFPVDCEDPPRVVLDGGASEVEVRLTCADAVGAAFQALHPQDRPDVVSASFHYGMYCPPGARCRGPQLDRGWVLLSTLRRGLSPDFLVTVRIDNSGVIHADEPIAYPFPYGLP